MLLDPRFPAMVPVESVPLLSDDVAYTEEVPVRVRWVIADLGGHTVEDADLLVTTDLRNELVQELLAKGADLIAAPSLLVGIRPDRELPSAPSGALTSADIPVLLEAQRELEAGPSALPGEAASPGEGAGVVDGSVDAAAAASEPGAQGTGGVSGSTTGSAAEGTAAAAERSARAGEFGTGEGRVESRVEGAAEATVEVSGSDAPSVDSSGAGFVDGEVVATDEHTALVAGLRRTARTEVPSSVMDEIEDAVALMARALRQGEWEQSMTHETLLPYLRAEAEEFSRVVAAREKLAAAGAVPEWAEQELCQELSDVLLQVLFHAEIANRRGSFDIGHVAGGFVAKMRSRAPYLFEDVERPVAAEEQERLWEDAKRVERQQKLDRIGPEYRAFLSATRSRAAEPQPDGTPQGKAQPADAAQAAPRPVDSPPSGTPQGKPRPVTTPSAARPQEKPQPERTPPTGKPPAQPQPESSSTDASAPEAPRSAR